MIVIDSQAKYQRAERKIDFCYLCGEALHRRRPKLRTHEIIREHVFPKTAFAGTELDVSSDWSVCLSVHKHCEVEHKREADQFWSALARLNSTPPHEWREHEWNHVRRRITVSQQLIDGVARPLVGGIEPAAHSIIHSARGCFTLLFNQFVPLSMADKMYAVVPSVFSKSKVSSSQQVADWADGHQFVGGILALAVLDGLASAVRIDAKETKFECAFIKGSNDECWCAWQLSFPLALQFGQAVAGVQHPWRGIMDVESIPAECVPLPLSQ